MSSVVPVEFFIDDLKRWKYITLSEVPNIPDNERKFTFKEYYTFKTTHGLLLVLELKDDNGNDFTISYPDIQEIRLNNNSNEYMAKYYLECKLRLLDYKLRELEGEIFISIADDEDDINYLKCNSKMTHRIIFTN